MGVIFGMMVKKWHLQLNINSELQGWGFSRSQVLSLVEIKSFNLSLKTCTDHPGIKLTTL
jgi:hypothetical protein